MRPALVVQSDSYNTRLTNTIVALITKNIQRAAYDPAQFRIDLTTPEGQQSGWRGTSAVVCTNRYTVHERHIIHTIGSLPTIVMQQINQCLRAALDLP